MRTYPLLKNSYKKFTKKTNIFLQDFLRPKNVVPTEKL